MKAEALISQLLEEGDIFAELDLFMRMASRKGRLVDETGDDEAGWWLGMYHTNDPAAIEKIARSKIKSAIKFDFSKTDQGVDVRVEWKIPKLNIRQKKTRQKRKKGAGYTYSVYD